MEASKNKALFLDRDGVIINERGDYNFLPEHMVINKNILELMKKAQSKNYIIIVITNQGGIAKKLYTKINVENMHKMISSALSEHNIKIHHYFYCPHHSIVGKCICRKPHSLMIEKAAYMFNIDLPASFMVGDKQTDVDAANNVGVTGILIEANKTIPNLNILN